MTKALEKAFDEASRLPESEQNALGQWLLAEIESGSEWDQAFGRSQDTLADLAKKAVVEHRRGGRSTDSRPGGPGGLPHPTR